MSHDTTPHGESLLAAALDYHRRGWSVIPMATATKLPARKWKRWQTERAGERQLRAWFGNGAEHGVGVVFGAVSGGLASRDYDELDAYQAWADAYPHLAATLPTVATARGRHVYCIAAAGSIEAIRRQIGKASGTGAIKARGGELRAGPGCYSLLPPSRHPSGAVYRWLVPLGDTIPIIDLRESGFLLDGDGGQAPCHPLTPTPTHTPTTHPYSSHVSDCGIEALIERAIEASLPRQIGERHYCIFFFARLLKGIPDFAGANPHELMPRVERWHELALPRIATKEWDDTWLDFLGAWNGAKYPAGRAALASALARADGSEPPAVAAGFRGSIRRLIALCHELQRVNGNEPFFVACRPVAALLGVHLDTVATWLRSLCAASIIELVTPYHYTGVAGAGRAAEYRYLPPL